MAVLLGLVLRLLLLLLVVRGLNSHEKRPENNKGNVGKNEDSRSYWRREQCGVGKGVRQIAVCSLCWIEAEITEIDPGEFKRGAGEDEDADAEEGERREKDDERHVYEREIVCGDVE